MLSKTHSKYIQSLHHKKFRDAEGLFIAEGSKVVPELIQSGKFICTEMFGLTEWLQPNEQLLRKHYKGLLHEVALHELEKISALSTPNQVLAVFKKNSTPHINVKGKLNLVLDDIQDPGNLGTIIRIADWFGVENIICSEHSADMYNPKVVQSTMGSIGRVNVVYTNLLDFLQQHAAIKTLAAALNGVVLTQHKNIREAFLIIGNESKGIHLEILQLADEKITIPRIGEAESLNAAVATGIILSHLL